MIEMNIVATSPGATMGRTIWSISRGRPAPSTRAASSTSRGTSSKNERSIQTAIASGAEDDVERDDDTCHGQESGGNEEEQDVFPFFRSIEGQSVGARDG